MERGGLVCYRVVECLGRRERAFGAVVAPRGPTAASPPRARDRHIGAARPGRPETRRTARTTSV